LPLLGITDYAAHRGCQLQAVQLAISRGRIHINDDNLIDVEAADREWEETTQTRVTEAPVDQRPRAYSRDDGPANRARAKVAEPGIPYTDARALREVYEVQKKMLELEQKRSLLVRKEDVEREAFRLYRQLRDACMALPSRLAAQLAAESDEANVHDALEAEIRRIFSDFAEGRMQ